MQNLDIIKEVLHTHKPKLKEEYGVLELGVFGSYVRNEQIALSDVDILVEFEKEIDLLAFVHLKSYLSELLGIHVDLVMKKALKPNIGKRILNEVVYA
ncbi:MAG: nucleotidyltransferase family protein [Deltaproteobacteria bacterium]|nr:nucleotidyltransferase family protein [Deltaproteobacteria bacterium]